MTPSAWMIAGGAALALAGCWFPQGFVHDEVLVGPYRLVAVDSPEQMMLCRSVGEEGDCVGDGLPGETIFAAGANDRYITLARHPRTWPDPPDRSVTEYYYVILTADAAERDPHGGVRGPYGEEQFERERARLGLPAFSRTFENLR